MANRKAERLCEVRKIVTDAKMEVSRMSWAWRRRAWCLAASVSTCCLAASGLLLGGVGLCLLDCFGIDILISIFLCLIILLLCGWVP